VLTSSRKVDGCKPQLTSHLAELLESIERRRLAPPRLVPLRFQRARLLRIHQRQVEFANLREERSLSVSTIGSEWPGQGGGCGECVRIHWYTTSKQSGWDEEGANARSRWKFSIPFVRVFTHLDVRQCAVAVHGVLVAVSRRHHAHAFSVPVGFGGVCHVRSEC